MRLLQDLLVIVIISGTISLVVYLSLMPNHLKPTTYKEFSLEHFIK